MSKIVISHRGNLCGPHSALGGENSLTAIRAALSLNLDVEIDVWKTDNNQLFLGHDRPEHILSASDLANLLQHHPKLWWHAKNPAALEWAVRLNFHVFSHDVDHYVLTSNRVLWRYPHSLHNLELTTSSPSHPTVIVLPERVLHLCQCASCLDLVSRAHVCTDYPIFFAHVNNLLPANLWPLCQNLDRTYATIRRRPTHEALAQSFDTLLLDRDDNDLRCIAICSHLRLIDRPNNSWPFQTFRQQLFVKTTGVLYQPFENQPLANNTEALFHLTWLQLVSFENFSKYGAVDTHDFEVTRLEANKTIATKDQQFIVFTQCVRLPQTLALVGYPTWNISDWRQKARDIGSAHPRWSEPYTNDLVHATLFRFASPPCEPEIQAFLTSAASHLPLICSVTDNTVVAGTWKMLSF